MPLTLLEVLRGSVDELEGNELEATLLEAADDVADESALDTVGLQGARSVSGCLFLAIETKIDSARTLTMM